MSPGGETHKGQVRPIIFVLFICNKNVELFDWLEYGKERMRGKIEGVCEGIDFDKGGFPSHTMADAQLHNAVGSVLFSCPNMALEEQREAQQQH